jgi:glycosyltransferase involved in cell wall biosynthesis
VARHADQIAVISNGFQRYLEKGGIASDRIQRVCDWTHDGAPTESVSQSRERLGWGEREFICLHAGNMGQKQGLDTVLEAARLLNHVGIKIVLSGDGNDRRRLQERARELRLANVFFLELQPRGKYEAMLRAADALLLNQRPSVADMSLPSKLASYFASARPVVAAVAADSEAAETVRLAGAGIVVPPGKPAALVEAVSSLRSNPEAANELGRRGGAFAEKYLSEDRALEAYTGFLKSLISSRPGQ